MGHPRTDAQRLFRHFGLDPAQYVEIRQTPTPVVSAPTVAAFASQALGTGGLEARGQDLYDYRNFELGR